MAEKLIIKNFGPITELELDLRKITLLIGPQGGGKSTIAKLIAIFRDYNFLIKDTDYKRFFNNFNIHNYFNKSSDNDESQSYLKYICNNYEIEFENGKFNVTKKPLFEAAIKKEEKRIENLLTGISTQEKLAFQKEMVWRLFEIDKSLFSEIFLQLIKESVYVPAERILLSSISESLYGFLSSNISLPKFITDFGQLFVNAGNSLNNYEIKFLDVRYRYVNKTNRIFYDKKNSIKLSESASGFQAIIPLVLVIEYLTNNSLIDNSFVVEEPELNLYPTTQKDLIYLLSEKCSKNRNQLVITSHSPYVLSSFTNLLFAQRVTNKFSGNVRIKAEISKIINESKWINPEDFIAYYVYKGNVKNIFDEETGVIGENELDNVSDIIGDEFDKLMYIYRNDDSE